MSANSRDFILYYKQFRDKIYNYFLYRTGFNRDLAEDLTSEVFIKALKNFDSFDESKKFQSWIFTIAHNHLVNHYKASKSVVSLEAVEQTLSMPADDHSQVLEVENIIKVIATMAESDREPLLMRYVDGLSNQEIADLLAKDEGAVRTQLSRSLAKLREKLT